MEGFFKSIFAKKKIENCIYRDNCYACQITLNQEQIGDIFFNKKDIKYIIYKKRIAKANLHINHIEKVVFYKGSTLTIKYKGKDLFSAECAYDDYKKIISKLK